MSQLKVQSLKGNKSFPDQLVWETQGEVVEEITQEKYPDLVKRYNELLIQNMNLEMDLKNNKCQVNALNNKNTNLSKQIQDIGAKLHSSEVVVKVLSEKLENQKSEIEKEKFENEKRISNLKQQLENKEKFKKELPKERDVLKKELKEMKSMNDTVSKENSLLKDEVDRLKTEIYETGEQLYLLTQESIFRTPLIDIMCHQFGSQGEQLKNVEKELEETKNELQKSSTELLDLKISENETELKRLQAECKRQMEKDRGELDAVYKIVKEKDGFIISLQSDNEAMKERLVELIKRMFMISNGKSRREFNGDAEGN